MSELSAPPHFRYGLFLNPSRDDSRSESLQAAEKGAWQLSRDHNGEPVAVWDQNDNTLVLYAGFERFEPAK